MAKISEILKQNSRIYDLVLQDIDTAGSATGANGMTVEQILRAAIIKQMEGFGYRALAFHLMDSRAYSWFCRIVCRTRHRVLEGESVPAVEKIVSIFEEHTDIISKNHRDTYYGHKIYLTVGTSNLILDCVILEGNPADSSLTEMMLDRQETIYGRYPLKAAFDGGFSSQENPKKAKEKKGLKEVCFSESRGLDIKDMCRSSWMFKQLRNFRAGIESGISWLKRSLGLNRCLWKGFESFKSYVWAPIVSDNLLTMARHQWA